MKVVALKKHWDGTMLNIRTGLLLERARKRAASSKISSDDEQSKIRRTIIEGHVWFMRERISNIWTSASREKAAW